MASKNYWMVTNRNVISTKGSKSLGNDRAPLTYWVSDEDSPPADLNKWTSATPENFRKLLKTTAENFPAISDDENETQKHLTLFIHGYNNDWLGGLDHYRRVTDAMFAGDASMGICVLFSWPSDGKTLGYLPDRADARASGEDLANLLSELYVYLSAKQIDAAANENKACKAKTSIIAHSMGNFVLQSAMEWVWTRHNKPLLVSLINQVVMVAADVDNDLFKNGELVKDGSGEGAANLSYRIAALYTGRDPVLGVSAGLKHFGKRRLGRSGLDKNAPVPDNVWDIDCSQLFSPDQDNIHSAYFVERKTMELMRRILRGTDRGVVLSESGLPAEVSWPRAAVVLG